MLLHLNSLEHATFNEVFLVIIGMFINAFLICFTAFSQKLEIFETVYSSSMIL